MTVRKKPGGELEEVKAGVSTNTFRWIILVAVLSGHPMGREILSGFGFKFPEVKTAEKVNQTDVKVVKLDEDMTALKADISAVKSDVAGVKSDVKDVKSKVDQISMFQVDFERWKNNKSDLPNK